MAFSLDQLLAAGRNVASAAAGAAVTFGVLKGIDAQNLVAALNQISNGVTQIATGLGVIVGIVAPIWAAWRASKTAQVATVQAMPDMQVATTNAAVAAAVPDVKLASPSASTITVPVPKAA